VWERIANRMLSWPQVEELVGLSWSSVYRLERAGGFPRRRRLGPRRVGWLESEVQAWLEGRPVSVVGGEDGTGRA
jgi:prophage regulatory protein